MQMLIKRCSALALVAVLVTGCATQERSELAAKAKRQMIGLTKAEVLACMGPAKKKAHEDNITVWSYESTNGHSQSYSNSLTLGGLTNGGSARYKNFCTVNVVMTNDIVTAVNYNGPRSGGFNGADEQCAFAVENCVNK